MLTVNDRLVSVIDYLINFKQATEAVQLQQQHVLFQYAGQDMESMSAGGKILTRMGPANTLKLKNKLREIRAELIK